MGVDGEVYTRISASRGSNAFFAVDLGSHISIGSVRMVVLQQGVRDCPGICNT